MVFGDAFDFGAFVFFVGDAVTVFVSAGTSGFHGRGHEQGIFSAVDLDKEALHLFVFVVAEDLFAEVIFGFDSDVWAVCAGGELVAQKGIIDLKGFGEFECFDAFDAEFVDVVSAIFPEIGVVFAFGGEVALVFAVKVEVYVDLAVGHAVFVKLGGKVGLDARCFGFDLADTGFLDFDTLEDLFGGEITEEGLGPPIFSAWGIKGAIFDALIEVGAMVTAQDHHEFAFDFPVGCCVQGDVALCHVFGGGLERGLDQSPVVDGKGGSVLIFPTEITEVTVCFGGIKEDPPVDAGDVIDGVLKDRRGGELWINIAFVACANADDLAWDASGFEHGFVEGGFCAIIAMLLFEGLFGGCDAPVHHLGIAGDRADFVMEEIVDALGFFAVVACALGDLVGFFFDGGRGGGAFLEHLFFKRGDFCPRRGREIASLVTEGLGGQFNASGQGVCVGLTGFGFEGRDFLRRPDMHRVVGASRIVFGAVANHRGGEVLAAVHTGIEGEVAGSREAELALLNGAVFLDVKGVMEKRAGFEFGEVFVDCAGSDVVHEPQAVHGVAFAGG